MKDWQDKERLLNEFHRMPILQVACNKTGIARSTYYRWAHDDKEFARKARRALRKGDEYISDLAESKLIKKINEEDLPAILFWLRNRSKKFRPKQSKIKVELAAPQKSKKKQKMTKKMFNEIRKKEMMMAKTVSDTFRAVHLDSGFTAEQLADITPAKVYQLMKKDNTTPP